jgi:hypothetical protein
MSPSKTREYVLVYHCKTLKTPKVSFVKSWSKYNKGSLHANSDLRGEAIGHSAIKPRGFLH